MPPGRELHAGSLLEQVEGSGPRRLIRGEGFDRFPLPAHEGEHLPRLIRGRERRFGIIRSEVRRRGRDWPNSYRNVAKPQLFLFGRWMCPASDGGTY